MARTSLLSPAQEIRLARRIELGDQAAKQQMIESNLRLVFALARPYRASGVPFADVVQEGMIGLVRAVERFDHRRGLKFSTYAVWWIRRSLFDAVGDARLIRIPPKANQQLAAVRRARSELERCGMPSAGPETIARRVELPLATVKALLVAAQVTVSLDQPVDEDASTLGELIADDHAVDPLDRAAEHEQHEQLTGLLRLLPERHRQVLSRRYGLAGSEVQSHEQIGAWLGIGAERSRQLEREALRRLRSIAVPDRLAA